MNNLNKILKMKSYFFAVMCLSVLMACSSGMPESAKTTELKVWGNCGMCKKTIEKSLEGSDGVLNAEWNKDTKMMTLSYDTLKTSVAKVEELIAASGYDTQSLSANDEAYAGLHECCKYDRK
jgi:copper chaperone CopZ